ncbi:hypothetical protein CK203_042168 [Vitis vinifera]|uniref:Uncharacterized protein n=1 Tax=Vitis vinifera TaxID=29760 RepID=A0A438HQ44_VITVI|nr:hypothetical protein CK203_042168 [Vitis vinifera]
MPTKVLENQQLANKLMTPFPNFEGVGALLTKGSPHKKGYKCLHPPTKKHYVTMDVTFVVNQPYFDITYLQGKNTSKWEDMWDWVWKKG